eukprot:TRINITY_DN6326_c0_g1_i3.p1 TRINITY_DN6326_c0_g1~~TRINITY_DN6326_c0_g1_i3.p1  ORF type:complete len:231 (+),score=34.01 TRINITY_DN6326_c0_g1_i3:114-806(+)
MEKYAKQKELALNVFLVKDKNSQYVMKVLPGHKDSAEEKRFGDIKKVSHPNITKYKDYSSSAQSIIMEYCDSKMRITCIDGDMRRMMQSSSKQIPEKRILQILKDTLSGLNCIHKQNLVHGNIKPSNILFTTNGTAKITGLEVSPLSNHKNPEAVNKKCTAKDDVWALGKVMCELCCLKGEESNCEDIPKEYSASLKSLIRSMLDRKLTAEAILKDNVLVAAKGTLADIP